MYNAEAPVYTNVAYSKTSTNDTLSQIEVKNVPPRPASYINKRPGRPNSCDIQNPIYKELGYCNQGTVESEENYTTVDSVDGELYAEITPQLSDGRTESFTRPRDDTLLSTTSSTCALINEPLSECYTPLDVAKKDNIYLEPIQESNQPINSSINDYTDTNLTCKATDDTDFDNDPVYRQLDYQCVDPDDVSKSINNPNYVPVNNNYTPVIKETGNESTLYASLE